MLQQIAATCSSRCPKPAQPPVKILHEAVDRHNDGQGAVLVRNIVLDDDARMRANHFVAGGWAEIEEIDRATPGRCARRRTAHGCSSLEGHVSLIVAAIVLAKRRSSSAISR